MILALRLARRELRGGARGLRIVLVCLALGVAAIAGVGSLRAAIDAGLSDQGRALLGGDLEINGGAQKLPDGAAALAAGARRAALRCGPAPLAADRRPMASGNWSS